MGHIYEWMEDEIYDFAKDEGIEFEEIEFPWKDNFDWDPEALARKDSVALLKDRSGNIVGKGHFKIVVNPNYGEPYEYLWIIDENSLRVEKIECKDV